MDNFRRKGRHNSRLIKSKTLLHTIGRWGFIPKFLIKEHNGEATTTESGPNKEIYRCEVKPAPATATMPAGSTIYLTNERTNDKWSCCVNSNNIDSFRSKKIQEIRFDRMHLIVLAILQEVLRGTLGPLTSSYCPTHDWCTLSLKAKHSRYFMKLTLDCQLGGNRGSWCFPMNPEDPGAIKNRERGAIAP